MAPGKIGPLQRLWYRWKSIQLPWRRQRLCGYDLSGTTYWEFHDALKQGRMRRIAKYPRSTQFSEVSVSPSWLQWLRHTRDAPPSIQEQYADVQRQIDMKQLAAQADARWNSQERFADAPKNRTLGDGIGAETVPRDPGGYVGQTEPDSVEGVRQGVKGIEDAPEASKQGARTEPVLGTKVKKENPWEQQKRKNPSEEWQPESWTPPPRRR